MAEKPQKTYRIVRLESENVKRLSAVAIEPNGNVIEITGANGAGKSSLLDSIFFALAGADEIESMPIRKGEQKAHVTVDLGTLVVTRRFTAAEDGDYTTTLTVESEEGARFQKPQAVLDSLVGALTMDPLEFSRMKPKAQFDALKQFVPGFDFEQTQIDHDRDFKARTDVNRLMKDTAAQAEGISFPEETPEAPIDESALVDEMQRAGEHNSEIERRKAARDSVRRGISTFEENNERRRGQVVSLRAQIAGIEDDIKRIEADIAKDTEILQSEAKRLEDAPALPTPIDVGEIRVKIDEARAVNADVAKRRQRVELIDKVAAYKAQSDALTKAITDREVAKQAAIATAKMPIEGIGFGDGMITLNGIPFEQASSAEQLRASVGLAMAANPRLRIILIRDGALLDDDSMKILAEMADKHEVQVWIETVASGRAGAWIIEDGHLQGDAKKLEAAE